MPEEARQDKMRDELTSPLCLGDPLAKALSQLEPRPTGLNRDALMFAAGAADRDRDVAFWRRLFYAQTSVLTLIVGVGITSFTLHDNAATAPQATRPLGNSPTEPSLPAMLAVQPPTVERDSPAAQRYRELQAAALAGTLDHVSQQHRNSATVDAGSLEQSLQLPRGVLAVPTVPKKPTPTP